MTGGRFRFFGLHGLPGIVSSVPVFRSQLVGLLQQGDLFLHCRGLFLLLHDHALQLVDALPEFLLFGILLRRLVERAQRGVQPLVGSNRRTDTRMLPALRFLSGCFHRCQAAVFRCIRRIRFHVRVVPERGQVAHHAPALLLPFLQLLLFVGFRLVADDSGVFRLGHVGVESLPQLFFLPVLLRGGEDEPHTAKKGQSHQRIDQHLPSQLTLFPCQPSLLFCFILLFFFRFHIHYYIGYHFPAWAGSNFRCAVSPVPFLFSRSRQWRWLSYRGIRRRRGQASRQ